VDESWSADTAGVLGRAAELEAAERFLAATERRSGPRALILRGVPGIGKTTLWQAALGHAATRGFTIVRAAPALAEAELAYAALADLLRGVDPALVAALPAPQGRALRVATLEEQPRGRFRA
jgi:hypothetical protein